LKGEFIYEINVGKIRQDRCCFYCDRDHDRGSCVTSGGQIELPFQKITKLGSDEVYVATTGRPKPPTTVDLYVWIYINKNNELVISKNKITAPTDALLKEKSINVRSNGLARDGSFDSKLVKSVKFAEKIRPISCRNWFYGFTNLVEVKNIENLYTDKCEDMYFMFYNCSSLKEINLKYFETSNVTDMRCMFVIVLV
jgi:bacterial surface protein 26-residue repeat protein (3 repeats) (fragment)